MLPNLSRLSQNFAISAALIAALVSCASTPPPNEKIAVATSSLHRAEQAGAPETAPVELAAARENLALAEKAAAAHDSPNASLLADKANVDAQLAEARTQQLRSHKAAMEFDASMQTLRSESMRSSQPTQ